MPMLKPSTSKRIDTKEENALLVTHHKTIGRQSQGFASKGHRHQGFRHLISHHPIGWRSQSQEIFSSGVSAQEKVAP
jgi:hypothetical protein